MFRPGGPDPRKQSHVYRISGGRLVPDLQSDIPALPTRVIAPLVLERPDPKAISILEPVFAIDGRRHVLLTGELAAVPAAILRRASVADRGAHERPIRQEPGPLFTGV